MFKENNTLVSQYDNALSRVPNDVFVFNELNRIKNGFYKTAIEVCRSYLDIDKIDEYKKNKSNLPAITFSGTFTGSHKKENLNSYSRLIIIDFDGLLKDQIEEKKTILFADEYVLAVWASPSKRGIKALVNTQSESDTHKIYFDEISKYLSSKYNLDADKSGSDICRLCFSSYDPNILLKNECSQFTVDLEAVSFNLLQKKETVKQFGPHNIKLSDNSLDKQLLYATEGRNRQKDRSSISKIIQFLKKRNISITSTYSDWYKVGLAIANTFTYDLGKKYYLEICRLDERGHDEYKSSYLLEYCYRNRKLNTINFASLLYMAEQKGFSLYNKEKPLLP